MIIETYEEIIKLAGVCSIQIEYLSINKNYYENNASLEICLIYEMFVFA